MPAKIDTEANLRFLYICFKHSNFSTVDFHQVAAHFQIKAPAARMRLMRLRQALEAENSREGIRDGKKRPRLNPFKAKDKLYALQDGEDDDDETLDDMPLMQRLHARMMRIKREDGTMIKMEDGTLIKGEDGSMIKSENGGFWVKKEEASEEQSEGRMIKAEQEERSGGPLFKSEHDDSSFDMQLEDTPTKMEDVIKSEKAGCSPIHHTFSPYSNPVEMRDAIKAEEMAASNNQYTRASHPGPVRLELDGYANMHYPSAAPSNHSTFAPFAPFSFRPYDSMNAANPFSQDHGNMIKPESANNHVHAAHFNGWNPPLNAGPSNSFTQRRTDNAVKKEGVKAQTQIHAVPDPGLGSPLRLDDFNAALMSPLALGRELNSARPEYVDPMAASLRIKNNESEAGSEHSSPVTSESCQDIH